MLKSTRKLLGLVDSELPPAAGLVAAGSLWAVSRPADSWFLLASVVTQQAASHVCWYLADQNDDHDHDDDCGWDHHPRDDYDSPRGPFDLWATRARRRALRAWLSCLLFEYLKMAALVVMTLTGGVVHPYVGIVGLSIWMEVAWDYCFCAA